MPRGFRIAIEATAQARAEGRLRDPRSFLGFKPNAFSELHELLYGIADTEPRRREIFERDGYKCVRCKKPVTWETGHLRHIVGGGVDRCWCSHNLEVSCADCHKQDHVQVRLNESNS